MCSRTDNEDGAECMAMNETTDLSSSSCRKCGEAAANVVLQGKFPYCRNCFIPMVSHKYRSTLGKSKLMKHGDRVLVAYSGSSSSVCLVNMIKTAMEDGKKKKIKTETVVMYVDDTLPNKVDTDDRARIISEIGESLKTYKFDKYYVALDSIFDENLTVVPLASVSKPPRGNSLAEELFKKCQTTTSANDLLKKLRYNLLYRTAKQLQCNKIFLAETSDHLAVSIISNVAMGRGAQLPLDVGFKDDRYGDIVYLRPLQECSKKEVTFYNAFCSLQSVTVPTLSTKASKFDNIQKLTEDFITNLSLSFPSTVHTVVATGSKLVVNQGNAQGICALCKGIIHKSVESLSSMQATDLSSQVSRLGPNGFDSSALAPFPSSSCSEGCSKMKPCCSTGRSLLSSSLPLLCYGCQLIAKEFSDLDSWPPSIRHALDELCFTAMRDEIQDFLL